MGNRILSIGYLIELLQYWWKMTPMRRKEFYAYKLTYYQFFLKVSLSGGCIAPLLYLVSDYQLNGSIWPTFIPRISTIFVMLVFWFVEPKIRNRKVLVLADYIVAHAAVLGTIWAVYHLQIKDHFAEGSITMHLLFFTLCLGTTMRQSMLSYLVFFAEILITNQFNHYPNLDIIISLNVPCMCAVLFGQFVLMLGALDQFLLKEKLELASVTDELTQVGNRKRLDQLLREQDRYIKAPASFVMLDIDHFKGVDDTYGHVIGDEVLHYLGQTLKARIGDGNYCIRYGGDEFILMLNDTLPEEGRDLIEEIRKFISEDEKRPIEFTISAGICSYKGDYERALKEADNALYVAKDLGRNQVHVSEE
ncbi:MAG: GGDEF domain-containing protein [Lachnospiraceae bacterium]|nr:GGDEF domain-containing protein [Lachnospiraceae bacterium]